jgi:hypothetical protein
VHLWGRRRTALAALFTLGVAALGVGIASLASAGATPTPAADDTWTITFRTVGAGCSSHPDPPSLTIAAGTRVTLVNETGAAALVDYGVKKPPTVAAGADFVPRLGTGEHLIRMVPQCPAPGVIDSAVVYVETNPASVGPGSGWPDTPTGSTAPAASRAKSEGSAVNDQGSQGPTSGPSATAVPYSAGPLVNTGSPPVLGGGPNPNAVGLPVGATTDPRGLHLLAVVALICILGVAVGIIRVIRAQRASSASQRVT